MLRISLDASQTIILQIFEPRVKILFSVDLFSEGILCAGNQTGKKGKRKVQGMPQLQTAALPRHQEEEETDNTK